MLLLVYPLQNHIIERKTFKEYIWIKIDINPARDVTLFHLDEETTLEGIRIKEEDTSQI